MFSSLWKSSSSAPSSTGGGFDVEEPLDLPQVEKHLFNKHHRGKIRSTGAPCSVFECDQPDLLQVASAAVKRLKTLRHPSIATYLDSAETSTKVTVVTEPLTPLSAHLDELDRAGVRGGPRDEYLAWGVYQVLRAVSFLNNDAKLSHNGLHGDAIFVSKSGDWKLFGLERVGPADPESHPAAPRLQSLQVR